jgi:L-alanine-DL-glutamate epimerase-like enolase superfamily enzyme
MVDANQQWTLPQALDICPKLQPINPFWIEEPTHPDDILGHKTLADAIAPMKLAIGEHVPNRVVFKNYLRRSVPDLFERMRCAWPVLANSGTRRRRLISHTARSGRKL